MKTSLFILCAFASLCLAGGENMKPYRGSPEFEKLKALEGTWKGTTDIGNGPVPITAKYRVISNGSAVEERLFADTPKEMVTIYHDKDGKLALTHYCCLGNQPVMAMVKGEGKSISFDLSKDCGVKVDTETHMHALTLTFDDADHLTHDWTAFENGKAKDHHPFQFERVK